MPGVGEATNKQNQKSLPSWSLDGRGCGGSGVGETVNKQKNQMVVSGRQGDKMVGFGRGRCYSNWLVPGGLTEVTPEQRWEAVEGVSFQDISGETPRWPEQEPKRPEVGKSTRYPRGGLWLLGVEGGEPCRWSGGPEGSGSHLE